MPRRALTGLAGALVAGLALTSSAAAGAATYCVHHSGCSGSANVASIQAAITKASADGALDTILVGPGSYHGPFSAAYGNPVALVGAGDATVLDAPGTGVPTNDDNRTTLALGDPGSSASSLAVVAPVGNGGAGVAVPNSDRLKVTDTGSSTGATGLAAIGTSDHARVTMTGAGSHGVLLAGRLRHARVSATANAVSGNGVVENSLLRLTQAGGQGA